MNVHKFEYLENGKTVDKQLLSCLTDFVCYETSPLPVRNGQYQDGQNTKQNQMKNTCLFYILFQLLKVLLLKICKIEPPDLLFLVVLHQQIPRYYFPQIFRTSFNMICKKDFRHKFSFFNGFTQPLPTNHLNSQNLLSMSFLLMPLP